MPSFPSGWSPTTCDHTAPRSETLGSSAGVSAGDGVESTTGAVAVGPEEWLFAGSFRTLPVPQFEPWLRFQSPLVSRVGDWRAGLGRSLCSLLARSFGCECHTISAVPRFQPPPRRTQHADFPHCALLFASPQGLWDLSCRSGFRRWSNHSVAIEQLQSLVQPSPTPPRPAEALSVRRSPMDIPSPEHPGPLSLRLDVYSPPQVLQIDGRLCHLVLAFLVVGDFTNSRAPSLHGRYPASTLLRTHPSPSRLRSTSRLSRLYDRPCSGDFAPGRGGFLQLLGMSLSPCCRFHPAEVKEPPRSVFGSPMQPSPSG